MPTEKTWNPNTHQWDTRDVSDGAPASDREKFQVHGETTHKTADEVQHSGGLGSMGKDAARKAPANTPKADAPMPLKEPLPEQSGTSSKSSVTALAPKGADADTQADAVESSNYKKKDKEG